MTDIRWDHEREERTGIPEVVFGRSKTIEQVVRLFSEGKGLKLATQLSEAQMEALKDLAEVDPISRTAVRCPRPMKELPSVGIVTGGTGDIPAASEALAILKALGYPSQTFFDVGVAGLHRLQGVMHQIHECPVLIVAAGMEGALPSVVAGLVDAPIIALPTSVGSGVSAGGHVALMSMLASCSPGIAVVNIDNGFGAACMAIKVMNKLGELNTRRKEKKTQKREKNTRR